LNLNYAKNKFDAGLAFTHFSKVVLIDYAGLGNVYDATVSRIADFGVFVKLMGGVEGFIHVSDLSDTFVESIEGFIKVGQEVKAKMIGFDRNGKVKLSLKSQQEKQQPEHQQTENQLETPTKVMVGKDKEKKKRFF
jgi:predicted RNA-binding protein with RPS1 domain